MILDYLCLEYCRDCRGIVLPERGEAVTLCSECWQNYLGNYPRCEMLENSQLAIKVVTAVPYSARMKNLIHRFKYKNDRLIGEDLVLLLESAWWHLAEDLSRAPIIVPVPLHWSRRLWRGFNQSELLTEGLGSRLGLLTDSSILRRRKLTRPHHGLNRVERAHNVRDAFMARQSALWIDAPPIVLVDDIFTSGATLLECAESLLSAGFSQVSALAVCRA